MQLIKELPVEISSTANLRQAVLWIAEGIPPMPADYELAHEIPQSVEDHLNCNLFDVDINDEDNKYFERLSLSKKKLFFKLKKGELTARGCRNKPQEIYLKNQELNSYDGPYEDNEFLINDYYDDPLLNFPDHEEIPVICWQLKRIQWDDNQTFFSPVLLMYGVGWDTNIWGEDEVHGYGRIFLETEELMRLFPAKDNTQEVKKKNLGGRPTEINWGEFYKELACYIASHPKRPKTQSIVVRHMGDWCGRNWKNPPSESTLKDGIKPVFDIWKQTQVIK